MSGNVRSYRAPGYVTEKALQASLAGAMPIYDGGGMTLFNADAVVDAAAPDFLGQLQRHAVRGRDRHQRVESDVVLAAERPGVRKRRRVSGVPGA